MVAQVSTMTEALKQGTSYDIQNLVRQEVEHVMKETKVSISEMKIMLRDLLCRTSEPHV